MKCRDVATIAQKSMQTRVGMNCMLWLYVQQPDTIFRAIGPAVLGLCLREPLPKAQPFGPALQAGRVLPSLGVTTVRE